MNWNFLGHNWHLFGNLAVLAFVALLVFATCMSVYTARLRKRAVSPLAHSVGGYPFVLSKVRKREQMSTDELSFARQAIADRGSLWAFSIPATIFSLGCFYVLGSLEQLHGATPVGANISGDPDGLVHKYHRTGAAYEAPERAAASSIRAACLMDIS